MPSSCEVRETYKLLQENVKHVKEHYQLPLPLRRQAAVKLRNNREMALRRLVGLKNRFLRNPMLKGQYTETMNGYICKGYAKKVDDKKSNDGGVVWYLPHHAVTNPTKTEKTRVVFDCAAKYRGLSLNDTLMQDPDLTNS